MSNATQTPATEARCLRPGCGRKLTSEASKRAGFGPVCLRKIRAAALTEARADFSPAQRAAADELIRDGGIVETAPGLFEAISSKGDMHYATDGHSCTCFAGAADRLCYHQLAARVLSIASRRSMMKVA